MSMEAEIKDGSQTDRAGNSPYTNLVKSKFLRSRISIKEKKEIWHETAQKDDRYDHLMHIACENFDVVVKKLSPVVEFTSKMIDKAWPHISKGYSVAKKYYDMLPMDVLYAIIGLILAFFGGSFALCCAAFEAFYNSGWETAKENILYLYQNAELLFEKSKEDDKVDNDGDGVADVKKLQYKELFTRKMTLFFVNLKDPQRIMDVFNSLCFCIISVIAALKVDFAKVIALGTAIGTSLKKSSAYFAVPYLSIAIPEKFHHWIVPMVDMICQIVALSVAWTIQRIISSVQSGIRGGLLFSRRILKYTNSKGWTEIDIKTGYLDEVIGWSIAFWGIYFQLTNLFHIPFPLNMFLWPFGILENVLVWAVSK